MHNKQVLFILLCIWQVLLFAQPVNDDCSDAIEIPVTGNCISPPTYSNSDATVSGTDPVPSCWTPDETVWFTFTPTTGAVMISTNFAGSLSNTQVAVFAGSCGAFTELSCQEDLDAGLGITDVMLYVDGLSAGTTYYIMVDGFGGADGEFGICVEDMSPYPSPSGDDCPEAIFLCEEEDLVVVPDGTGGDGTLEEVPSCFGSGEIASWWYTFTAANTGTLTFDITPSGATNFDWAFYDISGSPGSMCNLSDELACNSAVTTGVTGAGCAGIACEPTLSLIAGHTYALLINRETAAFSSGFTLSFGGTVNFDSPETEFEYDPVVCVGESDGFEVEGGGDGMYYWSFGDGGVSTGDEPNHTYTSAGTYEVVLISFSPGGCYAVATETVIVSDGPDLSIDPEDPVICLGDGVTLDLSYVLTEDCEPLVFIMDEGYDIPEGGVLSIPIPVSGVAPGVMTADLLESVCIDVEHDTDSEVDIWLECPDGTQIELSTDNGGTGNDYNGTCFVLSGAPPVTSGTAPFAGSYLPEQPLSDFAGCTSNGIWYLNITDDTPGGGEGSIEFASLTFACDNTPDIVWSPATGLSSTTVEDPYASPVVTTTYTVTVTDGSGCTADTTVTVTVVDGASAGFIYTGSPYCPDDSDPLPVLDAGAVSGTWSATPAGLVIDAVTGAVDLSVSVPGTYTITNAIGAIGSCPPTSATFEIVIGEDAAILLDDDFCAGDTYILPDGTSTTTGGSFVFNLTAASGCDSVITLTLVAYSATASTIDASVCSGAAYVLPDGSTTTTAGTYTTTLTNAFGCDSVVTTNLTVDPAVVTDISGSICDGDTYTLPDGSTTTSSGIFSFTFVSAAGCDSIVTVDLTVNAVSSTTEDVSICDGGSYILPDGTIATTDGTYISTLTSALGCDSIITTNLSVTDAYSITLSPSICDGDIYTLPDGSTTTSSGIFSFTFVSAAGCDSIVTVDLTVNTVSSTTEDVSICDGGSYILPDGTVVTTDGTYVSTLTSIAGCDSIITTNVTVTDAYSITLSPSICDGDTYTLPDGSTTGTGGIFSFTFVSAAGCDSIVTVDLTVNTVSSTTEDVSICDGGSYILPDGTVVTTDGTYVSTLTSIAGCDSIITTNVTVTDAYSITLSPSICDGDTYTLPDGSTTGTGGIFSFTFVSAAGCDSIVTVDLTVNAVSTSTEDVSICDGGSYILPDGTVVTTDGTYVSTLTSIAGCDSIITTNLTVTDAYSITLTPSICDGDTYTLPDGSTTTSSGIFSFTFVSAAGCDSIVTVDLTVNAVSSTTEDVSICDGGSYTLPDGTIATTDGTYISTLISASGCDSIITTNITVTDAYSITLSPSICDGDVYTLPDGSTTGTGGIFSFTFVSAAGCDSIVTVDLTVNAVSSTTEDVSICDGGSYTLPDGTIATTDGTYTSTLTSAFGCDSIITTNLSVTDAYSITLSPFICDGDTYTLPDGSTTGTGGIFSFTFVSAAGCDSIVTVDLTVNAVSTSTEDVSICDGGSYTLPDGTIATTDGTYTSTLTSASGCDSIITINLTVDPAVVTDISGSICDGDTYTLPDGSTTTSSGIFSFTFVSAAGCDSIVTVDLTVNAVSSTTEDVSICDGGSYTLPDGTIATTDGTYMSTLTSIAGCDSIITTNVTVTDAYSITLSPSICDGDTYTLPDGSTTGTGGIFSFTFVSAAGCDSIVTVDLTVNAVSTSTEDVSICDGGSYTLPDGTIATTDGTYISTLTSAFGCDSIITTNVAVTDAYSITLSPFICDGDIYTLPDGSTTTSSGIFSFTFVSAAGCDSIVTVDLTVNTVSSTTEDVSICDGGSYTLPDGTIATTDGTYISTLTSAFGCDSIITTNIIVTDMYLISLSPVICEGDLYVLPDGSVTDLAGSWSFTFTSVVGCDSMVVVDLEVNPVYENILPVSLCEGESIVLPDGTLVDDPVSGIYTYTFISAAGCDSIVGVDLVVDPVDSVVLSPAICSGESYTLPDGSTTSSEGDYFYVFTADSGCDSLVTVNLVVVESWDMLIDTTICSGDSLLLPDATWASTDGTYVFDLMSSGGCDSVVTINLLLEMLPELSISTVDDAFCLDAGIQEIAVSPAGGVLSGAGIAGGFFDPELAGSGGPFWITYSYSTATGCLSSDSISVWVNDLPVVSFDAPPFICLEADPLLLSGDPAGGSFYGDGMADGYFVPSLSDTNVAAIYYTYTDAAGCTGTWTESISILTNVVDAGPDQVIEQGDSTMLLASGTGSLSWSPNGSLSCVDCSHPVASPQTTTTYTLTSTDPNGCIAVDQVTVTVIPSEEYTVFVPNTFTPNGDGANDLFLLYGYNLDLVLSFRIYDRWGQIVYLDEQFDPYDNQRGWDGSFQGQPVNAGVYAWVAEVRTKAGKQVIQYGNVTLLR